MNPFFRSLFRVIVEIVAGRVVVAAADLMVAAAHGRVNRSTRVAVQVEGEGAGCAAGGAGMPARDAAIGFQVWLFVEAHRA